MGWTIKARQSDGNVSSTLYDDADGVLERVRELRARGSTEVWIEDAHGRKVAELIFPEPRA